MVYRLTMRTFMVFEYIHPSGIKLRPARPLTNSILYIYNPIGNEWMHLCKEDIHGHLELLTCFSNGATMYQVIEGLKKVVEYWGDDYLVGRRDFYKEIIDIYSSHRPALFVGFGMAPLPNDAHKEP